MIIRHTYKTVNFYIEKFVNWQKDEKKHFLYLKRKENR